MENYQVVKWYSEFKYWYHNKDRSDGVIFPIYAPGRHLPAFQFASTATSGTLKLRKFTGEDQQGDEVWSTTVTGDQEKELNGTTYYLLRFFGSTPNGIANGLYYYELTHGTSTSISEIINICSNRGFLKIEYYDQNDITVPYSHMSFAGGFKFYVYLPASSGTMDVLGKPVYSYEETVHPRLGKQIVESIISFKKYQFESIINEPLADGMRCLKLFSDVTITDRLETKTVYDIEFDGEWESNGYAYIARFVFHTDTIVRIISKGRKQNES